MRVHQRLTTTQNMDAKTSQMLILFRDTSFRQGDGVNVTVFPTMVCSYCSLQLSSSYKFLLLYH